MPFLARRRREAEWMDEPGVDPELLRKSLRFIRRINTLLGYTRATLHHLDRFSRNWKPGQTIRIIDLATGSADIPRAILRWADRKGFDVRIVGVDRHAVTASAAALANADPRLQIVQADVFDLPFEAGSFDYALTAMFLHHLDERQIADVLRTMNSLATRGILVADLLRHYRAYAWITLFTLFANPMVRHDAKVSVGQALSRAEVLGLRDQAAITYVQYYEHFGHRFVLAGEKDGR
jgi:2-polyprenyl-3-methyl-5-hydroxy-6-metoxy-1,4-benzoquinol methylase